MSSIHSLLRQASCIRCTARLVSRNATPATSRLHAQWHVRPLQQSIRLASRAAPSARQKSPVLTNVYRAGTAATLSVGITRVATIVVFLAGSTVYAPSYVFSPDHSNWLALAFLVASAVPAIVTALATGPMVHAIRVHVPDNIKRSGKEALRRFSAKTPPDTKVELSFMRFMPWPQKRIVSFATLRRLRPSLRSGISNLEYLPRDDRRDAAKRKEYPLFDALLRRWMARYYVNRNQKKDRAAVPGVWDGMWKQIPFSGEGDDYVPLESAPRPSPKLRPPVPPMAPIGRP
ncbi:unnamed protein product [Cercospora beticola]|nr:unnamed protein product [Cercospora beticola]